MNETDRDCYLNEYPEEDIKIRYGLHNSLILFFNL